MTLALYGKSKRRQGGLVLAGLLAIAVALVVGLGVLQQQSATAVIVNLDSSTFAGSGNGVEGGWSETTGSQSPNGQNASRVDGYVRLTHGGSAIWKTISTVGYTSISVDFDCRGTTTNNDGDALAVDYSTNGGSTWTQISVYSTDENNHNADNCRDRTSFTSKSISFPAGANNAAGFAIRFRSINHNLSGEEVRIDNVVVKGDSPDADGDGVPNSTDQCPGTAPGATTYGTGCSVVQYIAMLQGGTANTISGDFCTEGDFNFVIDMSGSIGVQDGHPSNLPAMQAGITGFVNAYNEPAPGTGDGRYSGTIFNADLSDDFDAITAGFVSDAVFNAAVNALSGPAGFTPTAAGIIGAGTNNANDRVGVPNMMLVVTDGSPNVPNSGLGTGDPMRWVNAAQAAINAADAARANYLVRAVYVSAPGDPGDTLLPFNDADDATWAQAVMDLIDGSSAGALSADFSALATALLEASGCNPDITKEVLNIDLAAGEVSWTVQVQNDSGTPKTFWIFDGDATAVLVAQSGCTNNPAVNEAPDPWECTIAGNDTATLTVVTDVGTINQCEGDGGSNTVYLRESSSDTAPVIGTSTGDWSVDANSQLCEPDTVNVTFSKYICNSLGDIARNQDGAGDDDVGKPSMSATGGLSAQLGAVGALGNDQAVTPANDGRNADNCHLWGTAAGETGTWDMEIYNTTRTGNPLQTINIPQGGTITTALLPAVLLEALAPISPGARVEEVFKPGYGFGSLKCYTDHLHQDNWEWLDFNPGGIPTGEVHCIAYNVPADKNITIDKLFIGAFTADDYPTFTLDPEPLGFVFADDCTVAVAGQKVTWTCTVPYSWDGTVNETPKAGWQQLGGLACATLFAQLDTPVSRFFFCNEAYATIRVVKAQSGDLTGKTFTFGNASANLPVLSNIPGVNTNASADVLATISVAPGTYTVNEINGGRLASCPSPTSGGHITSASVSVDGSTVQALAEVGSDNVSVTLSAGEEGLITFLNEACAVAGSPNIIVAKFNDPAGNRTGTNGAGGFTFRVWNNGGIFATFTMGAAESERLIPGLIAGTVVVEELDPNTGGWSFRGARVDRGNDGSFEVSVAGQPGLQNIASGEVHRFNFYNQPRVNITATKTIYNNANPAGANGGAGWTFTLTGCGITPSAKTTDASGTVSWTDLAPAVNCTYTVTETAKAGWIADQLAKTAAPVNPGQTVTLNFINRQLQGCTNIADCPPSTPTTPTSTPVTPTSTPVPGETPTEDPTEDPTVPQSTVAGDRTPGPGDPTPAAPDTGAGFGATSSGMNILLLIAGLIAISGGLSFIALGRRPTSR